MINAFYSIPIIQRWRSVGYRPILRLIVIIGVLLLAIAASMVPSKKISLVLISLPIGIGIIMLFMRHPGLGILAIIPASFVVPFEIGVSSGSSLNASMLIIVLMTGLWLLDMLVIKRQIRFVSSRTLLPLVLLIVITVLAFLNGQLPWYAFASKAPITAQLGGVAIFIFSASIFLVTAHQIRDVFWLKGMVWVYLALGTFFFLTLMIPRLKQYSLVIFHYGSLMSLFWIWMLAHSFGQALFNKDLQPWQRAGLIVLSVITLYYAYTLIDGWKSGWVPGLVTLITLVVLRSKKVAMFITLGTLIALPTAIGMLIATDQYSYDTRIEAWLIIAEIVKISPILGLGPANYYWYTPLFPIRGYSVQFNSHNQFVDLVAQIGLLGLIAFLWILFEIGNLGLKLMGSAPEGFEKAYVYSALGGLAGVVTAAMLGDWVLPFVYNVGFTGFRSALFGWLFFGGLVALENIIEKGDQ